MICSQSVGCFYHVYYNTITYLGDIDLATPFKSLPALYPTTKRGAVVGELRRSS